MPMASATEITRRPVQDTENYPSTRFDQSRTRIDFEHYIISIMTNHELL